MFKDKVPESTFFIQEDKFLSYVPQSWLGPAELGTGGGGPQIFANLEKTIGILNISEYSEKATQI